MLRFSAKYGHFSCSAALSISKLLSVLRSLIIYFGGGGALCVNSLLIFLGDDRLGQQCPGPIQCF